MLRRIRPVITLIFILTSVKYASGQGFSEEKTSLANFVKRMYTSAPFEGVKVIEDYDHNYFISVVSLETARYPNRSVMDRVAQIKARQQANTFFNGSGISSDLVIRTTETKDSIKTSTSTEMIESIRENSIGFVEGMELLVKFDTNDSKRIVFIYYKEMKAGK